MDISVRKSQRVAVFVRIYPYESLKGLTLACYSLINQSISVFSHTYSVVRIEYPWMFFDGSVLENIIFTLLFIPLEFWPPYQLPMIL